MKLAILLNSNGLPAGDKCSYQGTPRLMDVLHVYLSEIHDVSSLLTLISRV